MFPSRIGRRARLFAIGGALAVGLAIPGAVLADTTSVPTIQPATSRGATIEVTGVKVTGKVVAIVDIAFVCEPFQIFDWQTGETIDSTAASLEDGSITLVQAQGRTIDWGTASIFGGPVTCDGSTVNTRSVPVTAAVTPWKTGTAVVGATVYLAEPINFQDSHYASSGALTVRLASR
jgi:hypothetical protein